jgi:hypothetical protein
LNALTEAALGYLRQGHHLLALSEKRPNPRYHGKADENDVGWSWEKSIHGVPETTGDIEALDAVFSHKTTTGVAILIPKDVLAADVDSRAAAVLFQSLGGDLETRTAQTVKGVHVWYKAPGFEQTMWLGGRTLLFKGFGGYVAAPPSRHFTPDHVEDGVYTWLTSSDEPMAGLPAEMLKVLQAQRALDAVRPVRSAPAGASLVVLTDDSGQWTWRGYAEWPIEGLRQAIIHAPDGNQNNMIAWAAMQARDEGVPYEVAMRGLLSAAIEGRHPRHRAVTAIRGAYSRRTRE